MGKIISGKTSSIYSLKSSVLRLIEEGLRTALYEKVVTDYFSNLTPNQKLNYTLHVEIETDRHGKYTVKTTTDITDSYKEQLRKANQAIEELKSLRAAEKSCHKEVV